MTSLTLTCFFKKQSSRAKQRLCKYHALVVFGALIRYWVRTLGLFGVRTGKGQDGQREESYYGRTELHGSALQWEQGCTLHCSRSGGLSRISQLWSLKRSPPDRWQTTRRVFIPPPQAFEHYRHTGKDKERFRALYQILIQKRSPFHLSLFSSQF